MYNHNLALKENQEVDSQEAIQGELFPGMFPPARAAVPTLANLSAASSELRGKAPACLINHIRTKSKLEESFAGVYHYEKDKTVMQSFEEYFEQVQGYPMDLVSSEDIRPIYQKWLRRFEQYSFVKQGEMVSLEVKYYLPAKYTTDFWEKMRLKQSYGAKRGEVDKEMSKKSAFRLKQVLLKSDLKKFSNKQMLFVTLTFPNPVQNIEKAKNILKVFNQHYKRKYGVGCVWKQEFQERTAVHYHLFQVFPNSEIDLGNYWIKQKDGSLVPWERGEMGKAGHQVKHADAIKGYRWDLQNYWEKLLRKYFNEEETKGFNAAIQADYVKNSEAVSWYFVDYTTKEKAVQNKVPDGIVNHGRWWGETNFRQFRAEKYSNDLSQEEYEEIQKDLAEMMGREYDEEKRTHYIMKSEKTNTLIEKLMNLEVKEKPVYDAEYISAKFGRALDISELYACVMSCIVEYRQAIDIFWNNGKKKYWAKHGIDKKLLRGIENIVELDDMEYEVISRFMASDKTTLLSFVIEVIDEYYY